MRVELRLARLADAHAIRRVHVGAFPSPAEADLVERLEEEGDTVISLVAEAAGGIVAHLLLSRMQVADAVRDYRAVGLGPVAVVPARQRRGIGAALIREALLLARDEQEELVFVVGDPAYYSRFGFSAASAAPFVSPYAGPHFMALALRPLEIGGIGRADYAAAFAELG